MTKEELLKKKKELEKKLSETTHKVTRYQIRVELDKIEMLLAAK